jgi:hypothetical protein
MRLLGIAFHDYNDAHGRLPPAVVYGKDGKPLYSWRVLLLPSLGEEELYKQFKLDEPWDSPHNICLLPKMPATYGPFKEGVETTPGYTFYQALVGKGTAFEEGKPLRFPDDFPDGTSNTIMVVEAATAVPWTKPKDIPYAADKPLPRFGGITKNGFRATMGDASLHIVRDNVSEATIRAAITRNAGDVLGSDW